MLQLSQEIERHLAFRDFMIQHPSWARQYSDLKRKLAETYAGNAEAYMDGKDTFIKAIDRKAAAWRTGLSA
ncbi:MAG: GrpB family protein [bacterium]